MTTAIVLDVEGTTSATEHVHRRMFPYARARIASWAREYAHQAQTRAVLDDVARLLGRPGTMNDKEAVAALEQWADEDRKIAPLKQLQGLIWDEGYRRGDLDGHVYWDTLMAVRQWARNGTALYIYSSGSVRAQQQLFAHTQFGDLTRWIDGYFDIHTAGDKQEEQSYHAIAGHIGTRGQDILFASDSVVELDAARAASWHTARVVRPEEPQPKGDTANQTAHPVYRHLLDVAEAHPYA